VTDALLVKIDKQKESETTVLEWADANWASKRDLRD
jgi:hypothetical protein